MLDKKLHARFAPSPTGYMHLGNAWAFLCAWLMARKAGASIVLRMEDIDPARSRESYSEAIKEDLEWLGLDWDEGEDKGPDNCADKGPDNWSGKTGSTGMKYRQSQRLEVYSAALDRLKAEKLVYPCFCTRKELRSMAGAPQQGDPFEAPYPGTCARLEPEQQKKLMEAGTRFSWRLRFPMEKFDQFSRLNDLIKGEIQVSEKGSAGDFPLCRSDGVFAYQLAVVLDDAAMNIKQIVRGEDILSSVPRQRYLYSIFGFAEPEYGHFPLMLDHEGQRLAKRHASLSVRSLRSEGVKPQRILGYVAHWAGLMENFEEITSAELLEIFDKNKIKTIPDLLPQNIYSLLVGAH